MAKPVNKIIAMCVAVELTNGCNNNQKLLYTPEREMVYKKEILQFQGLNVVQIMIAIGKLLFHIKWHTQTKTFA